MSFFLGCQEKLRKLRTHLYGWIAGRRMGRAELMPATSGASTGGSIHSETSLWELLTSHPSGINEYEQRGLFTGTATIPLLRSAISRRHWPAAPPNGLWIAIALAGSRIGFLISDLPSSRLLSILTWRSKVRTFTSVR